MILLEVLLLLVLHRLSNYIYSHHYVDLSLSQHVRRFYLLSHVPQSVAAGLHCHRSIVILNLSKLAAILSALTFPSFAFLHFSEPLG